MNDKTMRDGFAMLAALSLLTLAHAAKAQSTVGTMGASSTSTNSVYVNAYTGTAGTSGNAAAGDPPSTANIRYSGQEWTTPSVAGSYFGGANPCLVGIGASGAGGPVGLSFTFGRSDEGCQRRSDAATWHALGHDDVAIARMCQDSDNRAAFEALGMICPQDRPKVTPAAALAPATPPTRQAQAKVRPDWCETVSGEAERRYYTKVCAF